MSAFRYSMGRKSRETNYCTHIPVLRQSIVPAHKGSGGVNPREVLPWDPQNPVVFSTVTLGTHRHSQKSWHVQGLILKHKSALLAVAAARTLYGCPPLLTSTTAWYACCSSPTVTSLPTVTFP